MIDMGWIEAILEVASRSAVVEVVFFKDYQDPSTSPVSRSCGPVPNR